MFCGGSDRRPVVARLDGRGDRLGSAPWLLRDALAPDELAELGRAELAGPRERREARSDGVDVRHYGVRGAEVDAYDRIAQAPPA